jgi:hypothetical protein
MSAILLLATSLPSTRDALTLAGKPHRKANPLLSGLPPPQWFREESAGKVAPVRSAAQRQGAIESRARCSCFCAIRPRLLLDAGDDGRVDMRHRWWA